MSRKPGHAPMDIEDRELNLREFVGGLVDHAWLILVCTLVAAALGGAWAFLAEPVYRTTAILQVEPSKPGVAGFNEPVQMTRDEISRAEAEAQLVRSVNVVGEAVARLGLHILVVPDRFPVIGSFVARHFEPEEGQQVRKPLLGLDRFAWGGEELVITQLEVPVRLLDQPLELVAGEGGAWTLYDEDGNQLAEGRVGQRTENQAVSVEVAALAANPGTRFNVIRERRITSILRHQQALEVTELGEKSGVLQLALESTDPEQARLTLNQIAAAYVRQNAARASAEAAAGYEFIHAQLPELRQQLEQSERALNEFQAQARSVNITLEIEGVLDQMVELDAQISKLRLEQADIARRFTEAHPAYQTILSQIASLTAQQQRLAERVEGLPSTQQELIRLSRNVKVNNEMYMLMLNRAQELDVTRKSTIGNVHLVDQAVYDIHNPVFPNKLLTVALAGLLGAVLAAVVIVVRRALHPGIQSVDVIESLGLPICASVPLSPLQKSRDEGKEGEMDHPPLAANESQDVAVEALRTLRTHLLVSLPGAPNNRVMITGPTPMVGKSFVATNLAALAAQAGQRVLLIDADLRKGYLHRMLGCEQGGGLADLLQGRTSADAVMRKTKIPGLAFISRGMPPANPSELLMRPALTRLLEQASAHFDLVIIDTPPMLAVTDPAIVAQRAGTRLLVTRFDFTTPREIEECLQRFARAGVSLDGAVLNGVQKCAAMRYGYSPAYHQYDYRVEHA